MSNTRIATRYAKPLLELAEEQKVLEKVREDMLSFSTLCNENREFLLMLKSPIIPHLKKAEILKAIFGKKVQPLSLKFIDLVAHKNREQILPDVAREFVVLYNHKMGFQEATVTSSTALGASERKAFEKLVTDISGKKPLLNEKVNPDLIGGYVLKLDDQQIDDSVVGKLKDLKLRFQKDNR